MKKIRVNLNNRGYDIVITRNKLASLSGIIKQLKIGTDAVVITNTVVKDLFGAKIERPLLSAGIDVQFKTVPDGEKSKSEKYCIKLLNDIARFDRLGRRMFIIALGGGVIGDLAGFVASIYKRGVPYVQVPTTLLAQVDSSIGGKVAIDLKIGKNLAGSFYQPSLVFSDVEVLKTLPKRDLASGLAEVIKYGIISSPGLFYFVRKNLKKILKNDTAALERIIYDCASIKAALVEKDERDNKNMRVVLNFGHTIGHAIETAAGYSKGYSHGQAVALGMLAASFISVESGLLSRSEYLKIKRLIKDAGLPIILKNLNLKDIMLAQEHDKKFIHGRNRFVLPKRIGKVVVKEDISEPLIKEAITRLLWN
jgi:3-dehydroquinate synthase